MKFHFIFTIIIVLLLTSCGPTANQTSVDLETNDVPRLRSLEPVKVKEEILLGTLANWAMLNYGNLDGESYDVVVVGSEPEGISAAIAAAREGQKTLLIDKKPIIGGLYTLGMLNMIDINWSPTHETVNKGLFLEFYEKINNRTSFDVKQAKRVFENMLADEKKITVQLGAQSFLPIMNQNHVDTLLYKDSNGTVKKIIGKQYIDSTPDADFAQLAGANFTIGQEDFRNEARMMAVTLVFELSGVDWAKVQNYLNNDDEVYTGADQFSAWGYGKEMAQYKPSQENVRIRALNIGRQDSGHVLINAFQILGVNGLNPGELQTAWGVANEELPKITEFLRENLVGFKNVELVGTADEFYVRETRHLDAEYKLTVDDVLENRDFDDRIAFGSYPIDMQATVIDEGDLIIGKPDMYAVPFRSIVPKGFDNLLVAGRSTGYEALAHGSTRTVPVGMTVGQAAGIASAYANKKNISFQSFIGESGLRHMKSIQSILNQNGANLYPIPTYDNSIMNHWAYDGVKFLRSFGLIAAGYDNEYRMNETITKAEFIDLVRRVNQYSEAPFTTAFPFSKDDEVLGKDDLTEFLNANSTAPNSLTAATVDHLQNQPAVDRALAYMVIKDFLENR
ncbi:FAD-dependent oxidoreductase [Schinkia azotoformans]|uniref:FAD-dependent oxidoreductase n=1 Tax=Schinkia azotoformans TaxID=1454 RepID=UPI002DB6C977|nr:FAD-dependent oxidoreductase [Schinkia azotoformans]MEC1715472.1 FAD-dependent oxidoreductase [Schinkia azotoformans]MEC1741808.1 FAD-dependent oxidoreductase [Schinkia azotoformans]MEC1746029.1 FAD-dependent oxidoreductase [Schinkia azotoformans]MEC1757641.1 FAD-dependent oxidoreductase [Schinkia azotoformans]MEC1766968.1 FAD-dependent oxidoreductase [Schinkia azotoformans]